MQSTALEDEADAFLAVLQRELNTTAFANTAASQEKFYIPSITCPTAQDKTQFTRATASTRPSTQMEESLTSSRPGAKTDVDDKEPEVPREPWIRDHHKTRIKIEEDLTNTADNRVLHGPIISDPGRLNSKNPTPLPKPLKEASKANCSHFLSGALKDRTIDVLRSRTSGSAGVHQSIKKGAAEWVFGNSNQNDEVRILSAAQIRLLSPKSQFNARAIKKVVRALERAKKKEALKNDSHRNPKKVKKKAFQVLSGEVTGRVMGVIENSRGEAKDISNWKSEAAVKHETREDERSTLPTKEQIKQLSPTSKCTAKYLKNQAILPEEYIGAKSRESPNNPHSSTGGEIGEDYVGFEVAADTKSQKRRRPVTPKESLVLDSWDSLRSIQQSNSLKRKAQKVADELRDNPSQGTNQGQDLNLKVGNDAAVLKDAEVRDDDFGEDFIKFPKFGKKPIRGDTWTPEKRILRRGSMHRVI